MWMSSTLLALRRLWRLLLLAGWRTARLLLGAGLRRHAALRGGAAVSFRTGGAFLAATATGTRASSAGSARRARLQDHSADSSLCRLRNKRKKLLVSFDHYTVPIECMLTAFAHKNTFRLWPNKKGRSSFGHNAIRHNHSYRPVLRVTGTIDQ